jgi:hypothetical protein
MISRFFIIVIFFFWSANSVYAQSNMEDVVYLKNGGVTRGTILEIIPGKTIKIETKDRNIFVYDFSEIEKIVKEQVQSAIQPAQPANPVGTTTYTPSTTPIEVKESEYKKKGFHNITKLGPLGFQSYSVNMINGYQFNPYLLLGVGVGLDAYKGMGNYDILGSGNNSSTLANDYFLPIYVDFRYHVKGESRATFFTFFDMGYSAYLKGDGADFDPNSTNYYDYQKPTKGGTFFCTGIGLKVFVTSNVGLLVDFGLKFQNYQRISYNSNYYYNGSGYTYTQGVSNGLSVLPQLNLGVSF